MNLETSGEKDKFRENISSVFPEKKIDLVDQKAEEFKARAERFIPNAKSLDLREIAVILNQDYLLRDINPKLNKEEIAEALKLGEEIMNFITDHKDEFL